MQMTLSDLYIHQDREFRYIGPGSAKVNFTKRCQENRSTAARLRQSKSRILHKVFPETTPLRQNLENVINNYVPRAAETFGIPDMEATQFLKEWLLPTNAVDPDDSAVRLDIGRGRSEREEYAVTAQIQTRPAQQERVPGRSSDDITRG